MKKGIGIIFMLALVVIVSSLAVYFVEDITTPIIEKRQTKEIQEAVVEVFPAIEGTTWTVEDSTKDFSGSPITGAKEIMNGTTLEGIVYTVTFRGFSSDITYVVGVNRSNEITGYKTISQNDTAGYGAQIADAANWAQFSGMLLDAAGSGAFDGLSGASVTTSGWKQSFADVAAWHNSNEVFPAIPQIDIDTALIQNKLADDTLVVEELSTNQVAKLAEYDIDQAYRASNGTNSYIIYLETYQSYSPGTQVFLAVDESNNETVVFEVLANDDTPDWGGAILDSSRWSQLEGTDLYYLIGGDFDDLGGATTTYSTWQDAMSRISIYHQEVFQSIITYPLTQLVPVYEQQLTTIQLDAFTTWDLHIKEGIEYTAGVSEEGYAISYHGDVFKTSARSDLALIQGGFNFEAGKTYRIFIEGSFGTARTVTAVIGNNDASATISIEEEVVGRSNTFTASEDLTDVTVSIEFGRYATDTKEDTFTITSIRIEEYDGGAVADSDQVVNGSLDMNQLVDVTDQKLGNIYISEIYEVVDDLGANNGYIYYGYTFGTFSGAPTLVNFMLGIDKDGNYTGFRFLSTTDTSLVVSEIWTADYERFSTPGYFGEEIEGLPADTPVTLTTVAGLEVQIANIEDAINEIGRFHTEDYNKRYTEQIADAILQGAFDTAVSFKEIYNDYDYEQGVVNVYEAYDAANYGGTLLGYVYVGRYDGREEAISYVVGIKADGTINEISIYEESETWNQAAFDNYNESATYGTDFSTTSWLDQFDNLDVTTYVLSYTVQATTPLVTGTSTEVDSLSGVSTTTGGDNTHHGFIDSLFVVLKFHEDNSVGGAS